MRNIYTVNATQVVVSENHPEGVFSVVPGYPKDFDSRSYEATEENPNGSEEVALICARADYADRVKLLRIANNRAKWTVTLERADGRQIEHDSFGEFPDMTPEPTITPEPDMPDM